MMNPYESVIKFVENNSENNEEMKVFTFGVGNKCDSGYLETLAEFGRGSYCAIPSWDMLAAQVVKAIGRASVPALQNCSMSDG